MVSLSVCGIIPLLIPGPPLQDPAVEGSVLCRTWQRKRQCYGGEEKCKISPYTFPSVPFFSLAALTVVPSGCWLSLRGGIRSFIRSRPRASSKLRIFRVGEKPWMATGGKRENEVEKKNIETIKLCAIY